MRQPTIDVAGTGVVVLDRIYTDFQQMPLEALGGPCGNVLISLAMLHHRVVPLLALGHDQIGDRLINELAQAGVDTSCIVQRQGIASPVTVQILDVAAARHWFSSICPETAVELPQYTSITEADVSSAKAVLAACSVFYADRLTEAVLYAMATAAEAGAFIYFEPNRVEDEAIFARALELVTLLKYALGRVSDRMARSLPAAAISIVTHGEQGLEVRQNAKSVWCGAVPAPVVRDTCGSGDMVSVGIIDWILSRRNWTSATSTIDGVLEGAVAGQRLAAANCALIGARGLFQRYGAKFARAILDNESGVALPQIDPLMPPSGT
ncbi:MAG: hypothetical protein HYR63_17430 [Proteobacteria bacterium]|nr:hypothetical protein [Pseudomonadota bacterium]